MYINLRKSMLVYVVDDDQLSSSVLEDYLKKRFGSKMTIKSFETGESCLGAVAGAQPDIIILDYHLDSKTEGAADGIAILKKLKSHHPDIEVIMLSGQAKINVAIETMRIGAKDYVVKGETASLHISQIITGMIESENQKHELRSYKMAFWMAISVFGVIVLTVLILYFFFPEYTKHLPM